ncbi:MAG: methylmalonyl-CoA decarboxylase subunit alpha [Anaerophaga sp.]|uniref:acyl-CoA carboxylase subunit beta n=1 Tax=Anaerophaga thermohalophila TaxID=177400 RepID=UPI001FE13B41|nr:acyl-CoA carboxylase subunit beta [Anaerophaga thermohalophila]MDN5290317.1 methylmalonyl-CoA decarboxylase subunit alpha [Anaerophaga sp.]
MQDNRLPYRKFYSRKEKLEQQYGGDYSTKQHSKGKLTARERIELLLDEDSFHEIDAFVKPLDQSQDIFGDGVICGYGTISGRKVLIYVQDFNFMGGSLGYVHATKIQKVQDLALKMGHPIIGLIDSGGARIQEGIASLAGYAGIFKRNVASSGVVPQISVILGPAAGGAVYSPALTDFRFMVKNTSHMFVTGPQIVKEVLNEEVSFEELGGADVHSATSGVADFVYSDEEHCLLGVKKLLTYLPSNNMEHPPVSSVEEIEPLKMNNISLVLPEDSGKPYDVTDIIIRIVDRNSFFEVAENFAQNIVTGFGRLDNQVVGIIASQPKVMAGTLDINASRKAARFVRFCDAYNIPILVLEDVPGFMPGTDQEHNAIIMHGAKLLYAFSEATVPKITVILRKAYGGAYIVMNSKSMGGDFNFAWPTAEMAVMGPEGAVKILNRRELADADDPEALKNKLVQDYKEQIANPFIAEEKGFIDEVIDPVDTRRVLISAFGLLENKYEEKVPRKHGNIPL